jgi:hypothetical protein
MKSDIDRLSSCAVMFGNVIENKKAEKLFGLFPFLIYLWVSVFYEIGVQTALTSVYCSRTSWPISRPQPDSLYPPKGSAASNTL